MIEALFGKNFMGYGIVADQPGSFLALSTIGIVSAVYFSSGKISATMLIKRVILFPPFIAILFAILLYPFEYSDWMKSLLLRLSYALAPPLALLSVFLSGIFY
jgi:hypothetical protein